MQKPIRMTAEFFAARSFLAAKNKTANVPQKQEDTPQTARHPAGRHTHKKPRQVAIRPGRIVHCPSRLPAELSVPCEISDSRILANPMKTDDPHGYDQDENGSWGKPTKEFPLPSNETPQNAKGSTNWGRNNPIRQNKARQIILPSLPKPKRKGKEKQQQNRILPRQQAKPTGKNVRTEVARSKARLSWPACLGS